MDKTVESREKVSWRDLSREFPLTEEETERSRSLFITYEKQGYLTKEQLDPESVGKKIIIDFYYRLSLIRSNESPVHRKRKADWIFEKDFIRFNHRSLPQVDISPLFAQLGAIPSLRAEAVVLTPFTANRKGGLNTVDSHSLISRDYSDSELTEAGVSPEDQFHLFIEALHLLGKCVGFTLDYRMDRFAVAVLRRPELFRWIDRNSHLPYREMLIEDNQRMITAKVNHMVNDFLKDLGHSPDDRDYDKLRTLLASEGLWTVPSSCDGSNELPQYLEDPYGGIPAFSGGVDDLTTFKFHLTENVSEALRPSGRPNEEAVNYYSSLYIKWRDNFSFDFIKFGSIDNIDSETERKADSPDLEIVKSVIHRTSLKISHTGMVGSAAMNPQNLALAGFHVLLLGSCERVDNSLITNLLNQHREGSYSLALPCSDLRSVFLARFLGTGGSGITKYEISTVDMPAYHTLENIYSRYRELIKKGNIILSSVENGVAWWVIHNGNSLLIPLLSLETEETGIHDPFVIDYSSVNNSRRVLSVLEYDFSSSGGDLYLCGDDKIICEDLHYGELRLFSIQ